MKKIFGLLALSLGLSSAQTVSADVYNPGNNGQIEYCCPESCGWGTFSVGADWLYWKTEETGLGYGLNNVFDGETFSATVLKPKPKYDNGYRVFADYLTQDNQWKFCAAYTHVPSKASNSFSSDTFTNFGTLNNFNFPLFGSLTGTVFNSLSSSWHSKLNYVDLDVSRTFAICNNFDVIPNIGMRVLWMDQKLNVDGTSIPEIGDLLLLDSHFSGKFTGVGLKGGLTGAWRFYEGFSLVGNVGGSILYSHFKSHGQVFVGEAANPEAFDTSYRDSCHKGIPTFDSFIGLQYSQTVCGYVAFVHVGWEQHIIYDTNDFSLSSNGNTTLQGLTLGAAVAF